MLAKLRKRGQQIVGYPMMNRDRAPAGRSISPSERKPVWDASGSLASAGIDKNFVISTANILQVLFSLNNLTNAEADDASKVQLYAKLAEEKLQTLSELMRPMLWNLG